jgi:hypothetical protein
MWAAREKPFEDTPELAELQAGEPEDVGGAQAGDPSPEPTRGRLGRIALLVAVVGVEGVWLAFLVYGAWQLATQL